MIRKIFNRIYFICIFISPFVLYAQSNNEVQWSVFDIGFNNSTNSSSKILSQIGESFVNISNNGNSKVTGGFLAGLIISPVNSANDKQNIPLTFEVYQNFPNPFNPATKIKYSIASHALVKLKVYDILGKEITTLVNEEKPAGIYEVNFEGSQFASGIYIYRLQAGNFIETKKMILLR